MSNGEKVLLARQSPFQAIRLTENAEGLRLLRFGREGVLQSIVHPSDPGHLELPYARVLPACFAFRPAASRVLIVGLGGGTLPRFLHHHFPAMKIDVVEIDPDVVELAREYCGFVEDERLGAVVDDGRDFIEAAEPGGYDAIVLDSFDSESIPPHLTTCEFLTAVHTALSPAGVVIANIWGRTHNPLFEAMLRTYREVFPQLYVLDIPVRGTKLFIGLAADNEPEITRDEFLHAVRTLATAHHFPYDLAATVEGFRPGAAETLRGGTVLRD